MNDVKLQSPKGTHPLDENLRPLKIGDKTAPLELSDTDVRVNNLQVSGTTSGVSASDDTKLPLAGGTMTGDLDMGSEDIVAADGFTIDVGGDMSLDVAGGDIALKAAGSQSMNLKVNGSPIITMYESAGSTDDYFRITTTANGTTALTTADAAGSDADLTLNADGDIILDSHIGTFIAKKAGTEFSVANSAYAGMILGYTTVGIDATADSYILTTSFTVTDSAHKVKFVAPPSGVVEIFASIYHDVSRRVLHLGLSDNATYNTLDVTHEHEIYTPGGTLDELQINHNWVITGLTAGTAYEYLLGAKITTGTGGILRWGGDATGEYPPFIMKATALPTAVSDYAVYG